MTIALPSHEGRIFKVFGIVHVQLYISLLLMWTLHLAQFLRYSKVKSLYKFINHSDIRNFVFRCLLIYLSPTNRSRNWFMRFKAITCVSCGFFQPVIPSYHPYFTINHWSIFWSPGPIRRPFAVTWRMRHKYAYAPRKTPISSKEPISTSWLNEETSQVTWKPLEKQRIVFFKPNRIVLNIPHIDTVHSCAFNRTNKFWKLAKFSVNYESMTLFLSTLHTLCPIQWGCSYQNLTQFSFLFIRSDWTIYCIAVVLQSSLFFCTALLDVFVKSVS